MEHKKPRAFALWVTGLPASGKSTLVASLIKELTGRGVDAAILESDVLRDILTPHPSYEEGERETFYRQMAYIGALLVEHGVPVIFDATANRRKYREEARKKIAQFFEIYVDSPLELCVARDPKGIYRKGREGGSGSVPGTQTTYEPPENPEIIIHGDQEAPEDAARRVIAMLISKGLL